jgi:hypothetical protein
MAPALSNAKAEGVSQPLWPRARVARSIAAADRQARHVGQGAWTS